MTARPRSRANGEGSIYPYRNGYSAYVWVTTPSGERKRRYVYSQTRDEVHEKWLKLHAEAQISGRPASDLRLPARYVCVKC